MYYCIVLYITYKSYCNLVKGVDFYINKLDILCLMVPLWWWAAGGSALNKLRLLLGGCHISDWYDHLATLCRSTWENDRYLVCRIVFSVSYSLSKKKTELFDDTLRLEVCRLRLDKCGHSFPIYCSYLRQPMAASKRNWMLGDGGWDTITDLKDAFD